MTKGKLYLILSALLYGILPSLAAIAYSGGVNGITLTFLRSVIAIPLLYVLIRADKRKLKLTKNQAKGIVVLGIFGGVLPILCLYLSYNYISTGLATTLHFIYPILIIVVSAALYKIKISRSTLTAVIFVTIGVFMFTDINTSSDKAGIILAVLSGVFYSFYVIYLEHSGLYKLDFIVLTFYVTAIMSAAVFVFGLAIHGISFNMSPLSWAFSVLISLIVALGAMPLLQTGIKYEGAATAGIVSSIEPITSIIIGAVFLGEIINTGQIIGGGLIILGVLMSQREGEPKKITPPSEQPQ